MKNKRHMVFIIIWIATILLSACSKTSSQFSTQSPKPTQNAILTQSPGREVENTQVSPTEIATEESVKSIQPSSKVILASNSANLKKISSITTDGAVNGFASVAFTPDNTLAAISFDDRTIRLFNLDGSVIKDLETFPRNEGTTYNLKVSKDGTHLALVENYHTIPIKRYPFSFATNIYIRNFLDEADSKNATLAAGIAAFSADLSTLALLRNYSESEQVQIWQFSEEEHKKILEIPVSGLKGVAISADGSMIASDYSTYTILWQTKDGERIRNLADAGVPLVFSEDGTLLATKTDEAIKIWSVSDGTLLQSIPYKGWINRVVFSPNSEVIAAAIMTDIHIWSVKDGTLLNLLAGDQNLQIWTNTVVFSPDGKYLAYDRFDTIMIWGIP